MPSPRISKVRRALRWLAFPLVAVTVLWVGGCTHVAGNFPTAYLKLDCVKARFIGDGFQLLAGTSLRLDKVEAELDQLGSQGYSRRDPQIIKSVARRKHVPVALLADRSGNGYYRFTACLDPGASLSLTPGALKVTVMTKRGTTVAHDLGYLLEDRRLPGGCRPPSNSTLALESTEAGSPAAMEFLVKFLESIVLWRIAAFGRSVYNQQYLATISLTQVDLFGRSETAEFLV